MALGTAHVTVTTGATFIPEVWSDEIVAAYKRNLVLAAAVSKMSHAGKKGDTVHIPKPARGAASAKAAQTAVTLIAATETEVEVSINKHFEYSRLIEDIVEVQAQPSLRKFYTEDAGYSLSKQLDSDIATLCKTFGDDNGAGSDFIHSNSFYVDAANGIAAYAVDTVAVTDLFTDLAFRELVKELDDNDTPMDGRFLVIPPSVRSQLMGIDRYVSSDFVSSQGVQNGLIGQLYGVDIYVSNNLTVVETAAANSASAVDTMGAIMSQRDAMVVVEQQGIRTQTQYKQEWLGDLITADTIYGVKTVRPESGLVIAVAK